VTKKTQGWSPAPDRRVYQKTQRDTHFSSLIHVGKGFQRIKKRDAENRSKSIEMIKNYADGSEG